MKKTYKYQVVSEQKQPQGHMLYLLRYKANNGAKSEYWVGQSRLRRFYEQDRLTDQLSDHVKEVVTRKPIKPAPPNKGKVKLEPRIKKWNLPDFEVNMSNGSSIVFTDNSEQIKSMSDHPATGRAYLISREDGRYCVVYPDGTLDEDWTPLEMAQSYANSINEGIDEK